MIEIRIESYQTAFDLSLQIPEFQPVFYSLEKWQKRLFDKKWYCLVAYKNNIAAGFKIGYFQDENVFYSWMGGVLPEFRKIGIGKKLAERQEAYLIERKVSFLTMKTHNRHKVMLIMAIKNDFKITKVELEKEEILNAKIYLQKKL